jgi:hypothetical protein
MSCSGVGNFLVEVEIGVIVAVAGRMVGMEGTMVGNFVFQPIVV